MSAAERDQFRLRHSSSKQRNEPILQASSPDEVSLVKFAIEMNTRLMERDRT